MEVTLSETFLAKVKTIGSADNVVLIYLKGRKHVAKTNVSED